MGVALETIFDPAVYPHVVVPCNLCGGNDVTTVATVDRYGLPTRVVKCDACGLEFLSPRMSAQGYTEFYRCGYRPLVEGWRQKCHLPPAKPPDDAYPEGLAYFARRWLPASGALLDVGGSTGYVSRHLAKRFGYQVTVVDPAPDEVVKASGHAICASVEDVTFPPETFDVVLCCRTLDHLLNPRLALTQMGRWATPAGVLICDVMNVAAWNLKSRYKVDHPYAFTQKTFSKLLQATGWRVRAIWTSDAERYVGVVCTR